MKIDSAIKEFSEKYDRAMMESVERLSNDRSLILTEKSIKVSNIKESFDNFNTYLEGYAGYVIQNKDNEKASPREYIKEEVNKFLNNPVLYKEQDLRYNLLPSYIKSYIEGVSTLLETVEKVKTLMSENDIMVESVGDVNEFVDTFLVKITESFDKDMDKILWASGYKSNKKIFGNHKKERPVFV